MITDGTITKYTDSKNINNITIYPDRPATGVSSEGVSLDGTVREFMFLGTSPFYESSSKSMSISTWIYSNPTDYNANLLAIADTSGGSPIANDGFYLILDDRGGSSPIEGVMFSVGTSVGSAETVRTNNNALSEIGWHHVVATYGNDVGTIYVDGVNSTVIVNDGSGDFTPRNAAMHLAKMGTYYFNASIDEVLIYNKSLTASEVEELYKAGLSQHANANVTLETRTADSYNISDAGLVGLWGLNGNAQ